MIGRQNQLRASASFLVDPARVRDLGDHSDEKVGSGIVPVFFLPCFGKTPKTGSLQNLPASAAPQQHVEASAEAPSLVPTSICSFTFTSGTKETFLKYCVTANGNITQFESPAGFEHIAVGEVAEGYGVCDGTSGVSYFDYADDGATANWDAPTLLSRDAASVQIARNTSDGIWTLIQTVTQIRGTSSVNVAMTLKNNSAEDRLVFFLRYADVDAAGVFNNNLDGTSESAFGWNSAGVQSFGLVMRNVGNTPFAHAGFAQPISSGPSPCKAMAHASRMPVIATDGSIVMFYNMFIRHGVAKTITINYRGF